MFEISWGKATRPFWEKHIVFFPNFEVRVHSFSTLLLYLTLLYICFSFWGQKWGHHIPKPCPLKEIPLVLLHLAKLEFTNFICSMVPAISGSIPHIWKGFPFLARKKSLLLSASLTPDPSQNLLLSCLLSMTHQVPTCLLNWHSLFYFFVLLLLHSNWLSHLALHCQDDQMLLHSFFIYLGQLILSNWTSEQLKNVDCPLFCKNTFYDLGSKELSMLIMSSPFWNWWMIPSNSHWLKTIRMEKAFERDILDKVWFRRWS